MSEQESDVVRQLREHVKDLEGQVKERDKRIETLEPIARDTTFKQAGVDLDDPRTKFFVERYDGELTVEAIREAAEPYGFVSSEQNADAQQPSGPDEQTQRMSQLRSASTPEGGGKRLSRQEWLSLSETDPAAAREAHASGLVDGLPSQQPARAAG